MKAVFLDFDGVCNSRASRKRCPAEADFDPYHIAFLNQITDATGAVIVLSSSWRFSDEAQPGLVEAGATAPIVGCIPDLLGREGHYSQTRCREILAWVSEHPDVTHYVILDDLWPAAFEGALDHLVHCQDGLEAEHVPLALGILRCSS